MNRTRTGVLVAALVVVWAGWAGALGVPRKANFIRGYLVMAYEPCTGVPDRTLGSGGLFACAAKRSDGQCGFAPGGKGQFSVKVTEDDAVVFAKLTGLDAGCEGKTLDVIVDVAISSDDCSVDECTTASLAASAGSCVVSNGKCKSVEAIGPGLMSGGPLATPNHTYAVELHGVRLERADLGAATFVSGVKLPKPAPACTGIEVGGYCWYLGAPFISCTTTCAAQGRAYDAATETYAGSSGTDAQCLAVVQAFGFSFLSYPSVDCSVGAGCGADEGGLAGRCATPPTTADASGDAARVCACY